MEKLLKSGMTKYGRCREIRRNYSRRELAVQDVESARDLVAVGDEIEVMVLKWDDDGTILLSKKKSTHKSNG